ncbi:unnamed protein product [Schistosoma margrebowiei]|uniref:N-acetylgalactosaminide beta-1,3-galactosyltransferase n=1 Tax=Schistosoma margrebowiei TaxID=48269 RepID=A0A3P7ZZE5_9TREM|nr:unnamed protein product [Schistosoma margrebowiei]
METLSNNAHSCSQLLRFPKFHIKFSIILIISYFLPESYLLSVINTEGRNLLWNKTAGAIKYMAKHYANDYDYFMKADDDSYVIVENLRKILHKENPDKPFIMGRRFKYLIKTLHHPSTDSSDFGDSYIIPIRKGYF